MNPDVFKDCVNLLIKSENKELDLQERFDALTEIVGCLLDATGVDYKHPDYVAERDYYPEPHDIEEPSNG